MTAAGNSPVVPPYRDRIPRWLDPNWVLATYLGIGFFKPGPGTWASAVTVLVWWLPASPLLHPLAPLPFGWRAHTFLWSLAITLVGVFVSGEVARESGITDPHFVVIDEIAGQLIALIAVPARWQYALASFILFRGFDILKPPPLRKIEKLQGGWGIMLDDVGAGLYALALLHLWILFTHVQ